jgi:hypothetical protein
VSVVSHVVDAEQARTALAAVAADQVRYHPGLSGPALGYTWSEDCGGQMFPALRAAMEDLAEAGLIMTDPHRMRAQRGHRVRLTARGHHHLPLAGLAHAAAA